MDTRGSVRLLRAPRAFALRKLPRRLAARSKAVEEALLFDLFICQSSRRLRRRRLRRELHFPREARPYRSMASHAIGVARWPRKASGLRCPRPDAGGVRLAGRAA